MMCKFAKTNCSGTTLRRAALAGGLAMSVLLAALGGGAAAQPTTPNPNQTTQPTPYSWPGFHAGGTALYPFYDAAAPTVGTSPTNPVPYQALSPLYSQLMGTPTGFLTTTLTGGQLNPGTSLASEISSFLLGNYDPFSPPPIQTDTTGLTLALFPNHFADDAYAGGVKTWSAPFTYLTAAINSQSIVDDNSSGTAGQTYNGTNFGSANGWKVSFTGTGGFNGGAFASNSASDNPITPSGSPGYVRALAVPTTTPKASLDTATWTFVAPAATPTNPVAGLYTATLHLPNPLIGTDPGYPETRIPDAHYVVKNVTTGVTLFDGHISQTETNDPQYLAGPFAVAAGSTISVTLDNSTAATLTNRTYVLADSVSLTPGSIASGANAVNGSPTAINSTQYPEIQDALYYGSSLDNVLGSPTFGQRKFDNTNPYGNATIGTPNTDATHGIHQLVYFGRYETIVLTNAAGGLVDAKGSVSAIPITEQVGAIYCVNGITGDVVWRFQTPDVLTQTMVGGVATYTRAGASQAVFTTPTVARINVQVPQGTTPAESYAVATKLVVIVADDNGQVYCLDAIGNRNGISNTTVVPAGTAAATYQQPVYAPDAPLNTGTTISTVAPHVGTTKAYWVYRPDQTKESQAANPSFGNIRAFNATRDLPKPQAFGTASPSIYVDPAIGIDTATLAPNRLISGLALTSNATVCIGNSNGTLYALDAGGVPVLQKATTGGTNYLDATLDPYSTSRYVGIGSYTITTGAPYMLTADNSPVPTATPLWWFAANGAQTDNADATANVGITSAPALRLTGDPALAAPTATSTSFDAAPELYFTTGNDTTNEGRVWAIGLKTGPVMYTAAGTAGLALVPGSAGYNNIARPDWVFPNAFTNTGHGSDLGKVRPPLGSITGSPVVFTNPDDKTTRVYVAANSNEDDITPADQGRIWALRAFTETPSFTSTNSTGFNAPGEPVWCYPDYYNPNVYAPTETLPAGTRSLGGNTYNTTNNQVPEPLGAFQFAAPAIGVVQFPTTIDFGTAGTTQYIHIDNSAAGDGNRTSSDVRGEDVPMLYVGSHTEAPDSSNFFALDLDGSTDNERNTFYFTNVTGIVPVGTTQGAGGFECSPLLIVNSTSNTLSKTTIPGQGNGGVVFITSTDNNLHELSAVPTSDISPVASGTAASTAPQFADFYTTGGFGPFASPAAAAFSGTGIGGNAAVGGGAQDWIYGGDSKLGVARGITPAFLGGSGAVGIDLGTGGTGVDALAPTQVPLQFPLHAYVFDGKTMGETKGSGQTANMGNANNVGETLPAIEWGEPVYLRISNVVPPNDAVLDTASGTFTFTTGNANRLMTDATAGGDTTTVYTNGGPITIQLTDIAAPGATNTISETDSVTIPSIILPDSPGLTTTPPGNGFLHRAGPGNQDGDSGTSSASGDMLKDVSNKAWIGAVTYAIGDGSNRRNTPGARRRIVSATQIAQAYTFDGTKYTFVGSVTLQVNVDSAANQYTTFGPPDATGRRAPIGRRRIAPVDQPTFGILNPLAVQAGGYPLRLGTYAPANPSPGAIPLAGTGTSILGPFGGIHSPLIPANTQDLQAFANGNRIPRRAADLPLNGAVGGVRQGRRNQDRILVLTATGDINHGTTGDNADPPNLNAAPPTGNQGNGNAGYLNPPNANAPYGPYAMDVADRSALGNTGQHIGNLTVEPAAARWHDNSAFNGTEVYGPGAVVNPLPWETNPTSGQAGTNTSLDYPDIGASRLGHVLMPYPGYPGALPAPGGSITNQPGSLDPALGANAANRVVYADPLQVQVRVPSYQPANLQVYDQTNANRQITPDQLTTTSVAFPQGYVTNETIYVDSNHNRKFDPGEAYRTFRVFTGVPVDMSTTMDTATIDLGRLPQGFGLSTDAYAPLGTFMPYPTTAQLGVNPQNPGYVQFFKPLHVSNRGNVNLLNVHLDQKVDQAGSQIPLPLLGDSLDSMAEIQAYDGAGITGPRAALPNGVAQRPFLLRSSLDDDLVAAYGLNPIFAVTTDYPPLGATFHKARVGDSSPSVLTVPDVPRDNDPTNIGTGKPNLNISQSVPPVASTTYFFATLPGRPAPGTAQDAAAATPYIALAVPQGTPVGTYSQGVRLFEGVDPSGYTNIGLNGTGYVPILPPQYGNKVVNPALANPNGATAYAPPPGEVGVNGLLDTWLLSGTGAPLQPASSAAVIKATVIEGRLTNGASKGDLPQIDAKPTGQRGGNPAPSSNFLPSAFRDPISGNISTYWTSTNGATAAAPYTLLESNLSFANGYFSANTRNRWWQPINLGTNLPTAGVNSGISVFTDNVSGTNAAYALVQNVTGGGTTPVTNNLLCFPVTASSGALTGTGVPVSRNTSQSSFGAHGLYTGGVTFTDAYPKSTSGSITSDTYAFWYGGARGRSAIYFASALSTNLTGYKQDDPTPFSASAVLPIPAGLVSVSDPVAVVTSAPDLATPANIDPVIEVTYTGIAADGNADIYISRYRPYFVRDAQGKLVLDPNDPTKTRHLVALALLPSPTISEQLQATDGNLYYQARDVAWARGGGLDVTVGGVDLGLNARTPTYDRATGQLVYTNLNVTIPGMTARLSTAYVDLAQGRVRFGPQLSPPQPVYATFSAQARRITTDSRADTAPVAFLDTSYKPNDLPNEARVPVDRYWFLWRKSGASGTSTTPTLFYKTQRLSVALHDASGNPITPAMVRSTTAPFALVPKLLLVKDAVSGGSTYYDSTAAAGNARADIDVAHGRVYFPIVPGFGTPFAAEGRFVTITVGYTDASGQPQTAGPYTDTIHWLDEPRYHSTGNPNVTPGTPTAISPTGTDDAAIPIDTITNESSVTAFLDPEVLQKDTQTLPAGASDVPHKVWLFWNSTRNGTADLYYETFSPLFSASFGG